jgi:hypothetical protein
MSAATRGQTSGWHLLFCLVAAFLQAFIPLLYRAARDELFNVSSQHVPSSWCVYAVVFAYAGATFLFSFVHAFYLCKAIALFNTRRWHMVGVSALITDATNRGYMVQLPAMNFSLPQHVLAWSKIRVFLLNLFSLRVRKYQQHVAILFVPLAAMLIAVLFARSGRRTNSFVFLFLILFTVLLLGSLICGVFVSAVRANAIEAQHLNSLLRARFRVAHLMTRQQQQQQQPQQLSRLTQAHMLLSDLASIIKDSGLSNRLLTLAVDKTFLMKVAGVVVVALLTQLLRSTLD